MLKSFILIICLFPYSYKVFSQHHLSRYDYGWAIFHPIAAIKIKHKLPMAMVVYMKVKTSGILDNFENGGKTDAFRHAYAMAYLARYIKTKKLRKLGIAHEKGNKLGYEKGELENGERADSLACVMDLRNNELGFTVGVSHKTANDEELKDLIMAEIKSGNAWYLKRNKEGNYYTCDGKAINLDEFKGKWAIPKCLIPTNK